MARYRREELREASRACRYVTPHDLGGFRFVTGLDRAGDLEVLLQRAADLGAVAQVGHAIARRLAARGANLLGEALIAAAVIDRVVK